ncbi:MFS siderochrome iron transporter 1 [Pleodorina starrii]|nr:MFS siderochrome iron transporter 1 [Pleodorina starrii]
MKADIPNTAPQEPTKFNIMTPWHPYQEDFARMSKADYPGSGTNEDPYVVDWLDTDAENPQKWPTVYKWAITMLMATATLAVGFCSSAYSGAAVDILVKFGVSTEIVTLGISLFVLGFALGPLIWAPLSEIDGRRPIHLFTYAGLTAFSAGCALAPNMSALIVLRFFAGAFGSSPLTNAGGILADMFTAEQRGLAMSFFAVAPFMGPVIGPIVGGFTGQAVGWRWVMWVMTLFSGAMLLLSAVFLPETYAPVMLRHRARRLAAATGKIYRTKYDTKGGVRFSQLLKTSLTRPCILLFREPIVLLLSIYLAIIYGVLYMLFAAFPIVYQRARGWGPGIGGLSFVGVAVGMIVALIFTMFDNRRYVRACRQHNGFPPAETRLPPAIIGACAIPVGLFWFAFTNSPSLPWIVSEIGTAPFGFGMVLVFLSCMNYLVDSYLIYAASVLAASSVLRSIFGAVFPLFTAKMYARLGIHWASALPGFLAVACLPFPVLFYIYGARIRESCKYAAEAARFMQTHMAGVGVVKVVLASAEV